MTTINNHNCSQELEKMWIKEMLVMADEICNGTTMENSLTVSSKAKKTTSKKASYHVAHQFHFSYLAKSNKNSHT